MNRTTFPSLTTVVGIFAVLGAITWAQQDDSRAEAEADEQDRAAQHSRDFAARQVCGPKAEPQWLDDKTLVCLRVVDEAYVARSTL